MKTQIKTDGLDAILKQFKEAKIPKIQIGILGDKDARTGKAKSNATVGAAHEYGAPARNLPMRSFLRVPLTDHLNEFLKKSEIFKPEVLRDVIRTKKLNPWMQKIGIVGEAVVQEAFASGGFGKWPALTSRTMSKKQNDQILVETGQLRDSITSRVV